MDDLNEALVKQLEGILDKAFTDEALKSAQKKIDDISCSLQDDLEYRIKDEMAHNLSRWVEDMAEKTVKAILDGNQNEMIRYLSCDKRYYTGRDREHSVIHGKLFEAGAIELRRKLAQAHADLIQNERILDLESQVASLVAQLNKKERENSELISRLNNAYVYDLSPTPAQGGGDE